MIGKMNEQQIELANNMQEYNLSHETDLKFSSLILEKIFDHPLTTLPVVAPS